MSYGSPLLNVTVKAALAAGKSLIRDFGEVENLQVTKKGTKDFVTNADLKAEQILIEQLSKARPDFGMITEESGKLGDDKAEFKWVIDPLDGTTNFMHGVPHFAVSVGVQQETDKGSKIVAGAIYSPIYNELYWAEKGSGAYMNNKRIRVSGREKMMDSYVGIGAFGHGKYRPREPKKLFVDCLLDISKAASSIRCKGSAAMDLAYVACGKYDGFIDFKIKRWDMAGGAIIVEEAGGRVTDSNGEDNYLSDGDIIATNFHIHDAMLKFCK